MGKHAFKIYPILGFFPFISENIFLRIAKNIITSAKGIKEEIQERYHGKNVVNIANGVSDKLFRLEPKDGNFVLFLGRIDVYMKGLDILLEAFSSVKNQHIPLKIAGSGKKSDEKKLAQLIKGMKLEHRVEFLGKVSEEEKCELLRTCLFLVMPSRFEGWGITAVEANAVGKAVLGTKIKGLSEAVVHGRTALLVETGEVGTLTTSLDVLIADSEKRRSLGGEGRIWSRRFSWKSISAEQFNFYKAVLGDKERL
jgi:glycosyltransferase involved in cell wall biosynthesis